MPPYASRLRILFAAIFAYHCKRPMIVGRRKTPFGKYASFRFQHAAQSPLALLLKESMISEEIGAVEILVKECADQKIDDTDLESVILSMRKEQGTLFILAYGGEIPSDDYLRLFRFFTRHLVIILPLGEKELKRLERWAAKENFNACLAYLVMLAEAVTSEPDQKLYGKYAYREKWQEKANRARLEGMKNLKGPQLRTLVKKLAFLLSFERAGMEIAEACQSNRISRKTFYLWREKDPIFRKLLGTHDKAQTA